MNTVQLAFGLKKEIWEFKKTLFWVPIIIAGLMLLSPLLQLLLLDSYQLDRIIEVLQNLHGVTEFDNLDIVSTVSMIGIFIPFLAIAFIVQLFYFTSCLYDERRDLSVYFWRSLPVSDAQTVLTKLITGLLVIPAIFMLAATLVVTVALVLAFIGCVIFAIFYDTSLWGMWGSLHVFANLGALWLCLLPYAVWLFPLFAWLMLASMYAPRAPFLWASLPIAAVLIIEAFFVSYFSLDEPFFAYLLADYFNLHESAVSYHIDNNDINRLSMIATMAGNMNGIATLLGGLMLAATYWLRTHRGHK